MFELSQLTLVLLAIVTIICGLIYRFFNKTFQYWKNKNLPFIKPIIPFGNTLDLYLGRVTIGEFFSKCYLEFQKRGEKHGGAYYFWNPVYIPVDPEIIKKIIISDFENFPNHGLYLSPKDDPLSAHIFNMEGPKWRTWRSKMPVAFTTTRMKKYFTIMLRLSEQFNKNLEKSMEKPLNIKQQLSRFTTDIISACAFGMESNTMKNENEELLEHGRQFFDYQWNLYKNTLVLTIPRNILQAIKFRVMPRHTQNYVINMFKNIREYRQKENIVRDDLASIIGKLMEIDENEKDFTGKTIQQPMDIEEYASQMFVFFAAGFETSSSTQTFAIYELAKNPDCQDRLRKEINSVLAKHDNKLSYDAVMEMKYLESVIDETLRIYPVFPILPRVCKEDYKVPGTDLVLEKNSFVMVSNMGIHRDPDYYPDPEKFDPDRFSVENKNSRPFVANMPFGEGSRICVGKRFGLLQTKVGLITMVKNYQISLDKKTRKGFKFAPWELILRKHGDVWINLKKITS